MSTDLFPPIDTAVVARLKLVQQMVDDDPKYLDHADCPYSEVIKDYLRGKKRKLPGVAGSGGPIDLEAETSELYHTLKEYGEGINVEDTKEHMIWLKTLVQVQEKLLSLLERAKSVKHMKMFEAAVFAALEGLEPHTRTEIIDRLKAASA